MLDVPAPEVIAAIQQSWSFVKKQADIMLLIDTSGSMESDSKLEQAKQAAQAFVENMDATNRVGLALFSNTFEIRVPLDNLETNRQRVVNNLAGLRAEGGTALNASLQAVVNFMNEQDEGDRIRAVVLLSDGAGHCGQWADLAGCAGGDHGQPRDAEPGDCGAGGVWG